MVLQRGYSWGSLLNPTGKGVEGVGHCDPESSAHDLELICEGQRNYQGQQTVGCIALPGMNHQEGSKNGCLFKKYPPVVLGRLIYPRMSSKESSCVNSEASNTPE